jgi:hypothetical protein
MPDGPRQIWLGLVWKQSPDEVTKAQRDVVHPITGTGSCGPRIPGRFRPDRAASRSGRD